MSPIPKQRSAIVAAAVLVGGLAVVSPASADNASCFYAPASGSSPALVAVSITPHQGFPTYLDTFAGQIQVRGDNGLVDCGASTLTNTDRISIVDGSPGAAASLNYHDLLVGATPLFAPGATPEAGDSDEIEFTVAFGPGQDRLRLDGAHGPGGNATIRLGASGVNSYINLNAAETTGIDQDVRVSGADYIDFVGNFFTDTDDDVRGTGGLGTGGAPIPIHLILDGSGGNDRLVGGSAADLLDGGQGADVLIGGRGRELIDGGPGNDLLRGGRGRDDLLSGKRGRDRIFGGRGGDRLSGGGGRDILRGAGGRDTLKGGPGRDLLVGGRGRDKCFGGPGRDRFIGCEIVKQN